MQTGDDSCHPITHIGKVPLALHDGKTKSLSNVLHVPSITKNLVILWSRKDIVAITLS